MDSSSFTTFHRRFIGIFLLVSVTSILPTRSLAAETVRWGSDDVTAKVGTLFTYHLTSRSNEEIDDACVGQLKISEFGKDSLPMWLKVELSSCSEHGDVCDAFIEGVPSPDEINQRYHISVSHIRLCSDGVPRNDGTDVFAIDVVSDDSKSADLIYCQQGKTTTTAAVGVDGDMSRMTAYDRVALLRRFAQHLRLPVSSLGLLPSSTLVNLESSVLVAGPGSHGNSELWASLDPSDVIRQSDSSVIRWTVGCGNVYANHMVVLERLEMTAQDGSLSSALGSPVLGWHVANQLVPDRHRIKRRLPHHLLVRPTTVPLAAVVRPTTLPTLTTIVPEVLVTEPSTEQTRQLLVTSHQTSEEAPTSLDIGSTQRHRLSTSKPRVLATRLVSDVTKPRTNKLQPSVVDVTRSASIRVVAKPTSPLPLATRPIKVASSLDEKQKSKFIKRTTTLRTTAPSDPYHFTTPGTTAPNQFTTQTDATTVAYSLSSEIVSSGGEEYITEGINSMMTSTTRSNNVEGLTTATPFAETKLTNKAELSEQLNDLTLSPQTRLYERFPNQPSKLDEINTVANTDVTFTSQKENVGQSSFSSEVVTSEISLVTASEFTHVESIDVTTAVIPDKTADISVSLDALRFIGTSSDQLTTSHHQPVLFHFTSDDPSTLPRHVTLATTLSATATPTSPQDEFETVTARTSPGRQRNRRPKKKKIKTTSYRFERKRTSPPAPVRPTMNYHNHAPVVKNPIGNHAPVVKNPIRKLVVEAGSVLTFPIANDTFVDYEDGGTANLQLMFTSGQYMTLPPNSWIKLTTSGRTLYGLPLDIHIGTHEFLLTAMDRQGKKTGCPFEVHVRRRAWSFSMSHEVSVVINIDYQLFVQLVDKRIDVTNKIGSVFGDRDPTRHIVVTSLRPGSVIYTWTNSSVLVKQRSICPIQEITALAGRIQHRNGSMNDRFVRMMRPYSILNISVLPHGPCMAAFRETSRYQPGHVDQDSDDDDERQIHVQSRPRELELDSINYVGLLYILIPLLILAAVLVVLLIFICCRELSIQRRHAKRIPSASSSTSALSAIRCASKGIPIIFADELVDGGGGGLIGRAGGSRRDDGTTDSQMFPPPDYRTLVRHGDWDTVASSSIDKDCSDNKSLGVSDVDDEEEEDQDDVGPRGPQLDSLHYRIKPNNPNLGIVQKTPVRGLQPPLSSQQKTKTGYNGNSPPPPYIQSYEVS